MKPKSYSSAVAAILVVLGLVSALVGCASGNDSATETTLRPVTTEVVSGGAGSNTPSTASGTGLDADALSTFRSKDPFIQQAVTATTTVTTVPPTNTTGFTTTTYRGTTSTYYRPTTTTSHGVTTTTVKPTTTTVRHLHSLKILSIGTVSGSPAVTFQVDNSVYKDRRAGDVVSTSWGQVKVVDINTTSKVATLLHGSETLIMTVGQQTYE